MSKLTSKIFMIISLIIIYVLIGTLIAYACGGTQPGEAQKPDPTSLNTDKQEGTIPGTSHTSLADNDAEAGIDPVLFSTGEFLFTRTDASVSGRGIQFPITRTYRSRPAKRYRHLIDDGEIKQVVYGENFDPNDLENYVDPNDVWVYNPMTTLWTDWSYISWMEPSEDIYYPIKDFFSITPGKMIDGEFQPYEIGVGAYQLVNIYNIPNIEDYLTPAPPDANFVGKAYRFELGTGSAYQTHLKFERKYYEWECLCPWPVCPYTPGVNEFFQCESCQDDNQGRSDYIFYNDGSWAEIYVCGFNTNNYEWRTIEETTGLIIIPEMSTDDIIDTGIQIPNADFITVPQPIPCATDSPIARSIENKPSLINWRPGWDMSYNIHLEYVPDEDLYDSEILLYPGDGNVYTYQPVSEEHPVYGEIWKCSKRDDFLKKWTNGTYTLYRKQNCYWQFNNKGYIDYISEKDQAITFVYDPNVYGLNDTLKLEAIEDNCGRRLNLIYTDPNNIYPGNLLQIVDHTGRTWAYDYYGDGNLKMVTDPNGFTETYEYDSWGRLKTIKDNDGNAWLTNTYDSDGRVHQQVLGDSPPASITYNPGGSRVVTDANGVEETFVLNEDGYSLSRTIETETGTATTLYERNSQNKLTKIIYPEQNGYTLTYDPNNGELASIAAFSSDPDDPNLIYTLAYDPEYALLTSVTDPRKNTVTLTYDHQDPNYVTDRGLLMKITYPQVTTNTGPEQPEINLTYTPYNEIETITSPDGIVLKYEYCENTGDPNTASDPNVVGMVKKVILDYGTGDCLNIEYTFDYRQKGRVVDVNDPFGNTTTLTYNMLDLLAQVNDPAGNLTRLTYNGDQKLTKVEREFEGGWQTFEYGYNIMAKLSSITDSLGNTTTLDYDDRYQAKEVTDAEQNSTNRKYNTRRLVREVIDAENGSTTLEYDDNGRLSVITDAEDADTIYEYDGYGRLEFVTYADDSYEQYGYDASSNLTSFRNRAGETITFEYDALNRLIGKTRPSEDEIELTYDIAGRLVEVSQDTEQMSFDYDRLGRLEETTDLNGYAVGYEYDDMGRRTKLTYPDDSSITYEYDDVGRLECIKDSSGYKIVEYIYDELSRTTTVVYYCGGSFVGSMNYDYEDKVLVSDDNLGNRIAGIDYYCNQPHNISYTYDNVGNMTSMDVGGNYDWTYGYDNTYQVTDADQGSSTNRAVDFTYDSVYNRTRWVDTLGSIDVSYSDNYLNQYIAAGGTTPTYDSRGNLTTGYGGPATLSYDCENRLVSANTVSFTYDLLGRRISRSIGALTTTVYVWDGAQIIAEYTNGSLTKKYIYGPGMDNPVVMINVNPPTQAETLYYYYADALGSIRLMTDAGGDVVEGYTYDPFGKPRVMTSAGEDHNWLTEDVTTQSASGIGNPYMFTGRRWYYGIGLYYYRFRDYAPDLGRFLQTDPAGYIDTLNLYAYCANNPVNWIDPWGLCKEEEPGLGSAIGHSLLAGYMVAEELLAKAIYIGIENATSLPDQIVIATPSSPPITINPKFIGTAIQFLDEMTGNSISDFEKNQAYNAGQSANNHLDIAVEGFGNTTDAIKDTVNDIMNGVYTGMEEFADPENWGVEDDDEW